MTQWRRELAKSGLLSAQFVDRYSIVLSQLAGSASAERIQVAKMEAATHPRRAVAVLAGRGLPPPPAQASWAEVLRLSDLDGFLRAQPPLEQTGVPLHPSRQARLVKLVNRQIVALRWPAAGVKTRTQNLTRMRQVAAKASAAAPLRLAVPDDYRVIKTGSGDPWVLSPYRGRTLEDQLRANQMSTSDRADVVATLAELRTAMLSTGHVWQGFAPRNMFLSGGTVTLIDFEEVAGDQARAVECLLWHRLFFADCLTPSEAKQVFAEVGPELQDTHVLPADSFERALLNTSTVTWQQRKDLLEDSIRLEGRHRRPNRRFLHGHELGHFWGDFVPIDVEARLFRMLANLEEPAACLEVLEAAMEADICRSLRLPTPSEPIYTMATADVLEGVGADRLTDLRLDHRDWYRRLRTDPARLIDELLHDAGTGVFLGSPSDYLIGDKETRSQHEQSLHSAVGIGMDFVHRADRGKPFLHHAAPSQLAEAVAAPLPTAGAELSVALGEAAELIGRYSVSQCHPDYLAFPDSGNAVGAVAGSVLAKLLNQNLIAVDRSAPVATFVEIQVIEWLRELVGYNSVPLTRLRGIKDVGGLWTTGGHLSNHVAMLTALGRRFPQARQSGLRSLETQPAVVMAGPIAHYSHSDAAFHLGLGWDAILPVAARDGYTTDPAEVEAVLADPPAGVTPFMVVGVAGNCRTTGLDDLAALGEICRRYGVWFHVDACHGGSLIFHPGLRDKYLAGIEQGDSVALDPHKGLFTPYPSSYVLFRDRGVLNHFSRHMTTVERDDCWDLGLITPFLGSRGFESLATWMVLRHVGTQRLGELVAARQAHVRYLERRIDASGLFIRLNDVDFYRLAFVYCPPPVADVIRALPAERHSRAARVVSNYTSRLNNALYESGAVCFDEHSLADLGGRVGAGAGTGYTVMATCPGNPLLRRSDLDRAVARLVAEGRQLVPAMLADLQEGIDITEAVAVAGPAGWSDQA